MYAGEEEGDDKTEGKNHPGDVRCHGQNHSLAWLPMYKEER